MPLDREHAATSALDHLDESISCAAGGVEIDTKVSDPLMMDRVHLERSAAKELREQRARFERDAVHGLVASPRLGMAKALRWMKVLAKRPAQRHIEYLGASTDSEHRDPPGGRSEDEGDLAPIAFVVDAGRLARSDRAVAVGRDVATSG